MIRHIVLWKLDVSYSASEKNEILQTMQQKLRGLKDLIAQVKSLQVGVNDPSAPESNFDIMLDTTFDSLAALDEYQVHPEHIKVGAYIKSLKIQRSAIDYPF